MADITVHHLVTVEQGSSEVFQQLLTQILDLKGKVDQVAYTEEQLLAGIAEARALLVRIADDMQEVLARERHLAPETKEALDGLLVELRGVEAVIPEPEAPPAGEAGVVFEPPVEPPAEPVVEPPVEPAPEAPPAEPVP